MKRKEPTLSYFIMKHPNEPTSQRILLLHINMYYLHSRVLYCIVLYCILRPYTDGPIGRYRIGIPRELSEIRTQPWLSEGSLTCDPYHHRGPIF